MIWDSVMLCVACQLYNSESMSTWARERSSQEQSQNAAPLQHDLMHSYWLTSPRGAAFEIARGLPLLPVATFQPQMLYTARTVAHAGPDWAGASLMQ